MNILYVYADKPHELNCSKWNCIFPAEAINRMGKHHASILTVPQFVSNTPEVQEFCNKADIIVVERNLFGTLLPAMEYWRIRNKSMIAIFDDGYDVMTDDNPAYPFWILNETRTMDSNITGQIISLMNQQGKAEGFWGELNDVERNKFAQELIEFTKAKVPTIEKVVKSDIPILTQFKWGLQKVKGIQVPSQQLADDWSKYNKTFFINNYLDIQKYMNVEPLYPHNDIVIGWQGSRSHYASFKESGVLRSLRKVAQKYDNVRIMIGGDKKIFDELELPTGKKVYSTYVPEDKWAGLLKSMDIAIAPLATVYDKRRSWVKVLEYMALGIPWVASNFNTYHSLKDYGVLVDNKYEEWENALGDMVENISEHRERAMGKPYEFALEQSYEKNIDKTIDIYQKIIDTPYE